MSLRLSPEGKPVISFYSSGKQIPIRLEEGPDGVSSLSLLTKTTSFELG
jgi:hypothetical protein